LKAQDERVNVSQAMQDAASERRKIQEEMRALKWAKEDEKRREMEAKKELERQKKDADKIAHKEEKVFQMILMDSFVV